MRALLLAALLAGCASSAEHDTRRALQLAGDDHDSRELPDDGRLESYVTHALAQSPALRERLARWRAAVARIPGARSLPAPTLTYAFYAMPVRTRVGDQRHRLGVRQAFPWPGTLGRAADARTEAARAHEHAFAARALELAAEVRIAWWRLRFVRRARAIEVEQLAVLGGLAEAMRARLEADQATLADVSQIELRRSRLRDRVDARDEAERRAVATLRAALGLRDRRELPTRGDPVLALPAEDPSALRDLVREHPALARLATLAEAERAHARAAADARLPGFSLGADWIQTAEGTTAAQDGRDAFIVSVGLSVPLDQSARAAESEARHAEAEAEDAARDRAEDLALAELERSLSAVADTHRRAALHRDTLLPQAQAAYESVVTAYAAGRSTLASVLLAHRDLLELALTAEEAIAAHGEAWARLERVVGRRVETEPPAPRTQPRPGATAPNTLEPNADGTRTTDE